MRTNQSLECSSWPLSPSKSKARSKFNHFTDTGVTWVCNNSSGNTHQHTTKLTILNPPWTRWNNVVGSNIPQHKPNKIITEFHVHCIKEAGGLEEGWWNAHTLGSSKNTQGGEHTARERPDACGNQGQLKHNKSPTH